MSDIPNTILLHNLSKEEKDALLQKHIDSWSSNYFTLFISCNPNDAAKMKALATESHDKVGVATFHDNGSLQLVQAHDYENVDKSHYTDLYFVDENVTPEQVTNTIQHLQDLSEEEILNLYFPNATQKTVEKIIQADLPYPINANEGPIHYIHLGFNKKDKDLCMLEVELIVPKAQEA